MKTATTYNLGGIVEYQFGIKSRKWEFRILSQAKPHVFMVKCPGGKEIADKVAGMVKGAANRCGFIDAMARGSINRFLAPAKRERSPIRF